MNKFTTSFAGFERGHGNKLAVKFNVTHRDGYVMSTITSGAVFRSYGAALKGARRAVATVAATGKFPNMCTVF